MLLAVGHQVRKQLLCSSDFSLTFSIATSSYQHILVEKQGEKSNVGLITLNRPKALNALCADLMKEVCHAVKTFEEDGNIGAIILTGSERAFAAGGC